MCVIHGHTCGVCFAKWTGQLWKETYDSILPLKAWTLVLNQNFQLCVEGRFDDLLIDSVLRIPIKKRVNSRWVATERTLIKLRGPLFSRDLPDFVVARFCDGIPENWKVVAEKWVDFEARRENSSYSLNFTMTSDSSIGSKHRRNLDALRRREARGKAASPQQQQQQQQQQQLRRNAAAAAAGASTASATAKQQSSDSAIHSIQESSTTPSNWVKPSPWLPLHKVREITQWMNRSPATPLLSAPDSEPGDGSSIVDLHLDNLPSVSACTPATGSSSPRNSAVSRLRQPSGSNIAMPSRQRNNAMVQSTPLTGTQDIRPSANPLNFSKTMSSVQLDRSVMDLSILERNEPEDHLFRKPTLDAHGVETSVARRKAPSTSTSPSPSKQAVEAPGAGIGRMENSSGRRLLRKHRPKTIERWRPILGVDGNLKLQGYLVLRGDMTAGQILTTNTVVKWSGSQVTTCDEREYNLIGDMYDPSGKISEDLKARLKRPMKCCDLEEALQETQALREDVTCFPYLAPPPAPEKICTTRSGRVCRPRAPYWLNRSDWGAEYDIFYNDSTDPVRSSSFRSGSCSTSGGRRNNESDNKVSSARTTPQRPPRLLLVDSPSSSSGQGSPIRRSLRLCKKTNAEDRDSCSDSDYVPSPACTTNSDYVPSPACTTNSRFQKRRSNNNSSSSGSSSRSSSNNNNNRVEDYVVHVSPSRIKVSYPSKSPPIPSSPPQRRGGETTPPHVRCRPQAPRSRTPRSPAKRSCNTCCGSPAPPPAPSPASTSSKGKDKGGNTKSGSKKKKRAPPPAAVDRTLRGTLGKTRLQTLNKSPRIVISPLSVSTLQRHMKPKKLFSAPSSSTKRGKEKEEEVRRGEIRRRGRPRKGTNDMKNKAQEQQSKKNLKNGVEEEEDKEKEKDNKKKNLKTKENHETTLQKTRSAAAPPPPPPTVEVVDSGPEDDVSVCSDASDMSVGPSASVIFSINRAVVEEAMGDGAGGAGGRRGPRTLKERRQRDAALQRMKEAVEAQDKRRRRKQKGNAAEEEDDPVAQLMSARPFQPPPQEWFDPNNWGRGRGRKRRRPSSSSGGTASPSRASALSSDGAHEDATSSVATPQLLMRRPDPKQVQSYLQRLRALNSKPHRPTRRARAERQFHLPDIDYGQAFRDNESSSDSGSESPVGSDWEG